jgi:ABC-type Fe3+ transport system permease subunit
VTLYRVVLPNLRTGLLSGAVLTLALVFGEYTISSILQFEPFSVWIVQDGQRDQRAAADRPSPCSACCCPGPCCSSSPSSAPPRRRPPDRSS